MATRLGLDGHARNLADGSVAVVASGHQGALGKLLSQLENGPPEATSPVCNCRAVRCRNHASVWSTGIPYPVL